MEEVCRLHPRPAGWSSAVSRRLLPPDHALKEHVNTRVKHEEKCVLCLFHSLCFQILSPFPALFCLF